jgi:hypothetical protein
MPHDFDPGYGAEPFRTLCADYPDTTVYPQSDFRTEWGPMFHRGRLDGSARVLVIGQDPAANETIARRILTGVAGQRTQGFLAKLGIDRSYLMINTFLYSVWGQHGGNIHAKDPAIAAYRNRWIDAAFDSSPIEAVVALGSLADTAWHIWKKTPKGHATQAPYAHIMHPTAPDSAGDDDPVKVAAATQSMLANWNTGLHSLFPSIQHPDRVTALAPYGTAFQSEDIVDIPEIDMPPGLPGWMRGADPWAQRTGATTALKRATITVTVPAQFMP